MPKQQKVPAFSEDFSSRDDLEAVLAIFCSYEYGANVFEEVAKTATDEKDYNKWSLCVIVCRIDTKNQQWQ